MLNSIFKIVYFILFISVFIVRKVFTAKEGKHDFVKQPKSTGDIIFLSFDGIGMIIPLIYVFSSWLDFANYSMPLWIGWIGVCLFAVAIYLLYLSHADLGKHWSPLLGIKSGHALVTHGIYNYIRHPMYAAHLLWAVAQVLILHNWIAGYSFIVVMLPHYLIRVEHEEAMLQEEFGEEYQTYKSRTGRIFPKIVLK
jgi:protein-S-isoprenylcysteine O-methyltransferase Ste14